MLLELAAKRKRYNLQNNVAGANDRDINKCTPPFWENINANKIVLEKQKQEIKFQKWNTFHKSYMRTADIWIFSYPNIMNGS